jgi:uncharacterized membrane protein SirB2
MIEHYHALRSIHIVCAVLTVTLFFVRGLLMIAGSPLLQQRATRVIPVAVDTVLLASAIALTMTIRQYPFVTPWLTVKVVLLVLYILLGSIALRRGRTRAIRIVAFAAALGTVGFLVTVALSHQPWGFLAG